MSRHIANIGHLGFCFSLFTNKNMLQTYFEALKSLILGDECWHKLEENHAECIILYLFPSAKIMLNHTPYAASD
jgi:hypothetical protein